MQDAAGPPFIIDPSLRAGLEGQAYVVLRPTGSIVEQFSTARQRLRNQLTGRPLTHPNSAHVTIKGFPRGSDHAAVERVVDRWAAQADPLLIRIEDIDVFGPPTKAVIFRVTKTDALKRAYTTLFAESDAEGLPYFGTSPRRTVDEWTFHISIAYCERLSDEDWSRAADDARSLAIEPADCIVREAELVHYLGGEEYTRRVPLRGAATQRR